MLLDLNVGGHITAQKVGDTRSIKRPFEVRTMLLGVGSPSRMLYTTLPELSTPRPGRRAEHFCPYSCATNSGKASELPGLRWHPPTRSHHLRLGGRERWGVEGGTGSGQGTTHP